MVIYIARRAATTWCHKMTLGTSDLEAAGTICQALITYPFLCLRVQGEGEAEEEKKKTLEE